MENPTGTSHLPLEILEMILHEVLSSTHLDSPGVQCTTICSMASVSRPFRRVVWSTLPHLIEHAQFDRTFAKIE